jgi:hypothetical protein
MLWSSSHVSYHRRSGLVGKERKEEEKHNRSRPTSILSYLKLHTNKRHVVFDGIEHKVMDERAAFGWLEVHHVTFSFAGTVGQGTQYNQHMATIVGPL